MEEGKLESENKKLMETINDKDKAIDVLSKEVTGEKTRTTVERNLKEKAEAEIEYEREITKEKQF